MEIIYEKNSQGQVFKKLPDETYHIANIDGGEFEAWILINKEVPLNTTLDSIII
jgi:hypothetical protein